MLTDFTIQFIWSGMILIEGSIMEKIGKILFWCMLMGFALQIIWMCMILFGGEAIYSFHSGLWGMDQLISKNLFFTANFIGVGLWKMAVLFFFAIPWLAIKIVKK